MALFNLSDIVAEHHRSLVNQGHSRIRVIGTIYCPFVVVTGTLLIGNIKFPEDVRLGAGIAEPLAAAFALLAGVLFGLSLTVLDKAIDTDLQGPPPGANVDRAAFRLRALAANTLYTAMISGIATGVLVAGEILPSISSVATAVGAGAAVLVGTNGALILGRVYRETKWRTDRARTGESQRSRIIRESGE